MTIDIDEYLKYIEHEEYIIYHMEHYTEFMSSTQDRWQSGYQAIFNSHMSTLSREALAQQTEAIKAQAKISSQGQIAAETLALMDELQEGTLLEETLQDIADTLNAAIEKTTTTQDFEALLAHVGDFSGLLENGKAKGKQLDAFFNTVVEGIKLLTKGNVPRSVFTQLTQIGKKLGPSSYRYTVPTGTTIGAVSKEDLQTITRVLDYLNTAAARFPQTNSISKASFRSTIANIFSSALGEEISKQMLSNVLKQGMSQVDSEVFQALQKNGLTIKNATGFQTVGTQQTNNKVNKIDIANSDAFELAVNIRGTDLTVEIGAGTSVKWYQDIAKGNKVSIKLVSGTTMGQVIDNFRNENSAIPGYTYNIFSHNWVDKDMYKNLRSSISASFINEWLSGDGSVSQTGQINKAQFLMVNGKLYSVLEIIKRICQSGDTSLIGLSIQGGQGKKISWEPKTNNDASIWDAARRRSERARKVINAFTVSASLNPNALVQYLT